MCINVGFGTKGVTKVRALSDLPHECWLGFLAFSTRDGHWLGQRDKLVRPPGIPLTVNNTDSHCSSSMAILRMADSVSYLLSSSERTMLFARCRTLFPQFSDIENNWHLLQ
uniref:Uncharacterized protein n=1 Tax=Trichuris muris TaxID=70415 RepID=A0A5S6QHU4_TRIMR